MSLLAKEETLFQRNENGDLIAEKVKLSFKNKDVEILATPMTRGEIKEMYAEALASEDNKTSQETDNKIIMKHCKNPVYSEEELKYIKPYISGAIVAAIFKISGLIEPTKTNLDEIKNGDDIKKN